MSEGNTIPDAGLVSQVTKAWVRASGHLTNSVLEANRATLAAFGLSNGGPEGEQADTEWTVERTVDEREQLSVGDSVTFSKTISEEDVNAFAYASGDTNRLHLDQKFAEGTRFGDRIAHGTLVSGLISAALARIPGMVIYLSQDSRFLGPVSLGERVTAVVEVVETLENDRYRLSTTVYNEDDDEVIDGEAVVLVDELPDDRESAVV